MSSTLACLCEETSDFGTSQPVLRELHEIIRVGVLLQWCCWAGAGGGGGGGDRSRSRAKLPLTVAAEEEEEK